MGIEYICDGCGKKIENLEPRLIEPQIGGVRVLCLGCQVKEEAKKLKEMWPDGMFCESRKGG